MFMVKTRGREMSDLSESEQHKGQSNYPRGLGKMGLLSSVGRMQVDMVWSRDSKRCPTCLRKGRLL